MHANLIGEQKHTTSMESTVTFRAPSALALQPSTSRASSVTSNRKWLNYVKESECESEKSFSSTGESSLKKNSHHQPTLSSGSQSVRLTNAILYVICKDSQPFQIVETEGFLNLMKVSAPLYKVPSRFTMKNMLGNKFIIQNYFKEKIMNVDSVTLTTDIWTDSMQTRSFLGVTMFFLMEIK